MKYKKHYARPNTDKKEKPVYKNIEFANKTEVAYAQHLDLLICAGEIESWKYEPARWRLTVANKLTTYTPDFRVVRSTHVEWHEVKGFLEEDANVKFKIASDMYPEYRWVMVRYNKKQWVVIKDLGGNNNNRRTG